MGTAGRFSMLVEEFDQSRLDEPVELDLHGDDLAVPARDRRPTDPGFVLTWLEYPIGDGDPVERTGVVLAYGPFDGSVWVVPDTRADGDGNAVLVRGVVRTSAVGAYRRIGGRGDHYSTVGWQVPRQLPRAVLRVDRAIVDGAACYVGRLHATGDCPHPYQSPLPWITVVERGEPVVVDGCYLYDRYLHPASLPPLVPWPRLGGDDPRATVCGWCLRAGPL